jgi:hypothetical protein
MFFVSAARHGFHPAAPPAQEKIGFSVRHCRNGGIRRQAN